MQISVVSFTKNGVELSKKLADLWKERLKNRPECDRDVFSDVTGREEMTLYTKCSGQAGKDAAGPVIFVEQGVGEWTGEQMRAGRTLLFIGACGIAVRAVAPHLTDKLHDSPVLVMDEKGKYVIPILSGHFGGANALAVGIAEAVGAVPVITTATDINRRFAVDLFAKKNSLTIVNKDGIARVSSKALAGQEITMSIETGHISEGCKIPSGIRMAPYPPEAYVDVLITSREDFADTALLLRPKEYVVGIGCRKGKEAEKIEAFLLQSVREAGIFPEQICAVASVDRKKDEQGLLLWSRKHRVPFLTYTAKQLNELEGEFQASAFVLEKVGVDNVCERAAKKACGPGGTIVYGKHAEDGMTVAIAKREWSVAFDEE